MQIVCIDPMTDTEMFHLIFEISTLKKYVCNIYVMKGEISVGIQKDR